MPPSRHPVVRITIIDPVVLDGQVLIDPAPEIPGAVIERCSLAFGTASVESRWDDAFAAPGIIDAAIRAEAAGADAVVVNCMEDPAVDAAREVVRIPVVGPAEAGMHLALCVADRFSILTTEAADIPIVREMVERHRLEHRCASIRAVGLPVLGIGADENDTLRRLTAAAHAAVEDGAAALVLGCTLFASLADRLAAELPAVPVIDPLSAALHHALTLVRLGVSHSAVGYPAPDAKPISWPAPDVCFGPVLHGGLNRAGMPAQDGVLAEGSVR